MLLFIFYIINNFFAKKVLIISFQKHALPCIVQPYNSKIMVLLSINKMIITQKFKLKPIHFIAIIGSKS